MARPVDWSRRGPQARWTSGRGHQLRALATVVRRARRCNRSARSDQQPAVHRDWRGATGIRWREPRQPPRALDADDDGSRSDARDRARLQAARVAPLLLGRDGGPPEAERHGRPGAGRARRDRPPPRGAAGEERSRALCRGGPRGQPRDPDAGLIAIPADVVGADGGRGTRAADRLRRRGRVAPRARRTAAARARHPNRRRRVTRTHRPAIARRERRRGRPGERGGDPRRVVERGGTPRAPSRGLSAGAKRRRAGEPAARPGASRSR